MASDRVVQFDMFSGNNSSGLNIKSNSEIFPTINNKLASAILEKAPLAVVIPSLQQSTPRVIVDAGEELTYNRRNRRKSAVSWKDIESLNDALKVKEAIKSNIWPKVDYQKLIDEGMQPIIAHIYKQVYDSVAVKPVVGRNALNDEGLQRYISGVNRIERGLNAWINDSEALKQWTASNVRVAGAMLGQRVAIGEVASAPRSLLDSVCPGGWRLHNAELAVSGGNKLLGALQPGFDECKRAVKAIKDGWPRKREAWEVQGYRIVENPEVLTEKFPQNQSWFLMVDNKYIKSFDSQLEAEGAKAGVKPFALFGKRGMVGSFDAEEAAVEAAKTLTLREKSKVIGEKGIAVAAAERTGAIRRMGGEDISSERLVSEFGLKGVNFGNWMKTPSARAEAQLHLNHAFDSLHDLAEIMGVPPKAMSLNGMLGLAIGAQGGGGGAAAHFVPGVNEINLTRANGAGSLAHEWAHALDHYFATQAGLASVAQPMLTEYASLRLTKSVSQIIDGRHVTAEVPRFGQLRPEIATAFGVIVNSMNKRVETELEANQHISSQLEIAQKGVSNWLKAIRKDFVGLEAPFDALAEKVAAGHVGEGMVAVSRSVAIFPVVAEIRDLYKAEHGRTYSLDNTKGLQAWVSSVKFQTTRVLANVIPTPKVRTSEFSKAALRLDQEKGGKPYWSTTLEKFARAFDAFVSDQLEAKAAVNDYLSHSNRAGETVPMGEERTAVNAAFSGLVNGLIVRDTEQGTALFSAGLDQSPKPMPMAEMQAEIKRLQGQWPSMPPTFVVQTVRELPFESPANADGAYCDGKVYVVADNIADLKQLQKVMAHECVMHHSLEEMLGDYGFSKLHHGIQKLKNDGDPVVGALAANILSRYGELPPEIETKEIVARAGEQCLDSSGNVKVSYGFMKGVFAGVTGWLRDHGISVPFTNAELQGIMHNAGEWVKKDRDDSLGDKSEIRVNGMVLNSFAGIRAESAPLSALRIAREMHISGVDDREIWKETGWTFAFADGKPRFEISDDLATVITENRTVHQIWIDMEKADSKVNSIGQFIIKHPDSSLAAEINNHQGTRPAYSDMKTNDPATAREIEKYLAHESLYKAYPELATVKAGQPVGLEGLVNPGSAAFIPDDKLIKYSKVNNPDQFMSTTLHELQHAIQEIEAFSPGGNPQQFKNLDLTDKELSRINKLVLNLYDTNRDFYQDVVKANQLQLQVEDKYGSAANCVEQDALVQEWWTAIDKRDASPESDEWFKHKSLERQVARDRIILSPMDQYSRLAGEVEARLTQARIDMTPSERIAGYPLDDMDLSVPGQVLMSAGKPTDLVREGFYVGLVLDVSDGVATQKINRAGAVVRHAVNRLSAGLTIGTVAEVLYKDGVGIVGGKDVALGVAR